MPADDAKPARALPTGVVPATVHVTIYAQDRPMFMRQALGTGTIPDSDYTFEVDQTLGGDILLTLRGADERYLRAGLIPARSIASAALDTLRVDYERDPSAPDPNEPRRCQECGSRELSLTLDSIKRGPVGDGLLRMHDVTPVVVLGCDECSATVEIIDNPARLALRTGA
jgi:hypothetical protein